MTSRLFLSSSVVAVVALAVACKKPPPPQADAGAGAPSDAMASQAVSEQTDAQTGEGSVPPAATTAPVIILLDAAPPANAADAAALALLTRWASALDQGDLATFASLFAPKVTVNGATVSAADHAKKTINNDPDKKYSAEDAHAETTADGKDTYVRFKKRITHSKADKAHDNPWLLIVRGGVIVEDSADPPDWCINADKTTNAKSQPGFKLSATSAVAAAKTSKHFAEMKKRVPNIGTDLFGFGCAKRCAVPKRECGYHFRMSDMEDSTKVVEWVYVDPVTKTLWWQETDWMSEQLR